jgi:NADH:ubiquinone oxidoreductase subunit 3 (subunit A)
MKEYYVIFLFMLFSLILAIALFLISFLLVIKNYDAEKVSPYVMWF